MTTRPRRIFVAGSTGATGRTLLRISGEHRSELVPHVRPATAARGGAPDDAAILDLGDAPALEAALADCTTVVQLIGTMRKRFSTGDTYETSDIGTTQQLVEAAKKAGVDHFVLLSSVGAGRPVGAYLKAKAKAEALVIESGIPYTILRPSAFVGEGHRPPPGMKALTRLLGWRTLEPITLEELASTILHIALTRAPLTTALEGSSLWAVVREAKRRSS